MCFLLRNPANVGKVLPTASSVLEINANGHHAARAHDANRHKHGAAPAATTPIATTSPLPLGPCVMSPPSHLQIPGVPTDKKGFGAKVPNCGGGCGTGMLGAEHGDRSNTSDLLQTVHRPFTLTLHAYKPFTAYDNIYERRFLYSSAFCVIRVKQVVTYVY